MDPRPTYRARARTGTRGWIVALVAAWPAAPALAADPETPAAAARLTALVGIDHRSGGYGLERDSELWYAPFGVKLLFPDLGLTPTRYDQLELAVTLPYLAISGPAEVVFVGGGAAATDRRTLVSSREQGIGDLAARATWIWLPPLEARLPALELTGRLRLPTGDERDGLGSGAVETSGQLDLYRSFGPVTPFLGIGYRFFSDSDRYRLRDGLLATAGIAAQLREGLSAGAWVDWRRAATRGADDPFELLPYLAIRLPGRVSLSPYGVIGLSDGSADWGLGLQLGIWLELRGSRP